MTDVLSVLSKITEVVDENLRPKHVDGAAIESVGSKPEEVDLFRARGTEIRGSCQLTSKGRYNLGVEKKDQPLVEDSTCREKKEFILLCQGRGNDTRLYHADVSKTSCDYSSYHVLHAQYYERLKGFWIWLTLREIFSIEFVKVS